MAEKDSSCEVAVVGASGFIGQQIVSALKNQIPDSRFNNFVLFTMRNPKDTELTFINKVEIFLKFGHPENQ
ncbi:MAG: hypothetical protein WCO72_16100 [Betaproteobacteria bacterium]